MNTNFKHQLLEDYFEFKLQNNKIQEKANKYYLNAEKLYENKRITLEELDNICSDITRAMSFVLEILGDCHFVQIFFNLDKPEFGEFYNFLINSVTYDNMRKISDFYNKGRNNKQ